MSATIRCGVTGPAVIRTPKGASASSTALASTAGGAIAPPNLTRVAADHHHVSEVDAQNVGGNLGKRRLVPLALGASPRGHEDPARRVRPHHRALIGPAGPLDIRGDPYPSVDALRAQRLLAAAKRVVIDRP